MSKTFKHLKNLTLGRDGERIVGESLETLKEKGYKVYHDVRSEYFNIDHVIIGPRGVFTIETKTESKSKKGNQEIYYDGKILKIDGFVPDRDPIMQAKNQKYWLQRFILNKAKIKIRVKPVIIYPGWYIRYTTSDTIHPEVMVFNEHSFHTVLDIFEHVLNSEQIHIIANCIENYNRI